MHKETKTTSAYETGGVNGLPTSEPATVTAIAFRIGRLSSPLPASNYGSVALAAASGASIGSWHPRDVLPPAMMRTSCGLWLRLDRNSALPHGRNIEGGDSGKHMFGIRSKAVYNVTRLPPSPLLV